jgi:hypothetical protein
MTTSDPPTGPLQNYGLKSLLNRVLWAPNLLSPSNQIPFTLVLFNEHLVKSK